MSNIILDLQQIILLSQAMLKNAKNGSWDDVIVLEKDRGQLLKIFLLFFFFIFRKFFYLSVARKTHFLLGSGMNGDKYN